MKEGLILRWGFLQGEISNDDRECDPYAIPKGFIATTIAIHLGKRTW